jgi:hypothetical protein
MAINHTDVKHKAMDMVELRAQQDRWIAETKRVGDKLVLMETALTCERTLHDGTRGHYAELQRLHADLLRIVEERTTLLLDMKRVAYEQNATMQRQHDLIVRLTAKLGIEPPDDLKPLLH